MGRPNAGKSSLLNALVGYDRAIVTDIPGTTRDTVEEPSELGGVPLRLIDTAGLRDTDDPVEQLGVERSRAAMEEAELILVLWDSSVPCHSRRTGRCWTRPCPWPHRAGADQVRPAPPPLPLRALDPMPPVVALSARTGEGLEELEQAVAALFSPGGRGGGLWRAAHQRPAGGGRPAGAGGGGAGPGRPWRPASPPTPCSPTWRRPSPPWGSSPGASVREDVTARIFQRFCVGK